MNQNLKTMLSVLLLHTGALVNSPLTKSSLPANVNFDPLNLASLDFTGSKKNSDEVLFSYREAELKHGRLAMLASVAYPMQETVHPLLSKSLNLPNLLVDEKLSPSLVNGELPPSILVLFLGLCSAFELYKMNMSSDIAGDYNWRLTDAAETSPEFFELQAGEVWNGRLAMLATLGYVVQEALFKTPVLFNA